jgi:hypothetical protein
MNAGDSTARRRGYITQRARNAFKGFLRPFLLAFYDNFQRVSFRHLFSFHPRLGDFGFYL